MNTDVPMSKETIQLAYDGEALHTGSMDVRDLAPALLSVGQLCERANDVLNKGRAEISVRVRSDFKTGSFELTLDVTQNLIEIAKFLFAHKDEIATAANLLQLIGLSSAGLTTTGVSLFKLIKWLKGRKAVKTTVLESGVTRIYVVNQTFIDNSVNIDNSIKIDNLHLEHIDVKQEVVNLYNDVEVRKAAQGVVKPLESEGIDTLKVREGEVVTEIVKDEDLPAFKQLSLGAVEQPLVEGDRKAALTVIKPSFEGDLKWMFSDGESRFNATMDDKDFLNKLDNQQIYFTKGDVLVVTLHSESYKTPTGIRTTHTVTEVLDIIHSAKQMWLLPEPTPYIEDSTETDEAATSLNSEGDSI